MTTRNPPGTSADRDVPIHMRREGLDPAPELARIRAKLPVARVRLPTGATPWLVTSYEHVREVLADPDRFGNDGRFLTDPTGYGQIGVSAAEAAEHGNFLTLDAPHHTRLRRLVADGFSPRRLRALQPRLTEIVSEALDAMEREGSPVDLVQMFAQPIPSTVICELLGVPYADRVEFQKRAVIRFDNTVDPTQRAAAATDSVEYMHGLVARNRAVPGAGILGMLVREHGAELSDRELAGIGDLLLLGGHETTANMLALSAVVLLGNPAHSALALQEQHLEPLVEELLRYVSVAQICSPRVARRDTTLGGREIRRGERLLCVLPSANRDEQCTTDADSFDPSRRWKAHLAFGHGAHYCIGATLARMELRTALPALLARFPTLRLDAPVEQIEFREFAAVYGVHSLPVRW